MCYKQCPLLITFAKSLDPDHARQNARPKSGSTLFVTLIGRKKNQKVNFEKKSDDNLFV